jgi:hypothetical protein
MMAILQGAVIVAGAIGADLTISGIAEELSFGEGTGFAVRGKAASDWIAVFGRQRIGGAQVDCSVSGSSNRWLWEVIAHACHPLESYDHIYLNGQEAFMIEGTNGLEGNTLGLAGSANINNTGLPGNTQNIQATDLNWQQDSNFYYDGNSRFWMARYDGTQTEADPFYMANCFHNGGVPHWGSTAVLKDTAYSILRYWWNANWAGSPPTVTQDVHGCNQIYDPRLDTTPGANPTNPAYLIYTANAALILAYYLTNTKFGAGFLWADINMEQLVAAANICDEQILLQNPQTMNYQGVDGADAPNSYTVTVENQFEINGCIDSSQASGEVISNMLSAMAGSLSYIGGQWNIFPGVWYGTPASVLTASSMVAPMSYSPKKKARELFNEVRAQFISPAAFTTTMGPNIDVYQNTSLFQNFNAQWKKTDMVPYLENPARNYGTNQWLTQDRGVEYIQNVNYPLTISHACCQRLSKIMLRRNRWQGTGSLTLSLENYNITPVDNIAFDYPRYGWTQKLFTVVSASLEAGTSGDKISAPTYKIGIQETDPSIYEWCVNITAADVIAAGSPAGYAAVSTVLLNDVSQGTTVITDELANTPTGMSQSAPTASLCAPVTNLVAESGSATMVTTSVGISTPAILVTWTPPTVSTATGAGTTSTPTPDGMVVDGGHYNVQVSTDEVNWNAVTTIDGTSKSFSITGLSDGTIVYVRVQAVRQTGLCSEWNQVGPVTVSDTLLNVSAADVYYGSEGNLLSTVLATTISAGNTALTNAGIAQADANAANALLAILSAESVLTPGQKALLAADVAALNEVQSENDGQAIAVGVSHAVYDAALATLNAYLATLTSPVAWNVATNYTTINGATLSADLQAAYSAQSALLSAIAATINSTAIYATPAINLVPDSNLQFGIGPSAYWSNPGSEWSVVDAISTSNPDPASPVPGCMALMVSAAASGTYQCTQSTPFQLVAGQTYTLSGFIDTYYVTAGTPVWQLYNPSITTFYVTVTQAPGQTGRVSITFTFSPVGVAAGTAVNVVLLFDTNACTISSGGVLLAAAPMIQPGSTMTAYIAGVGATNSTAGLAHGAMSSSVQGIITASTSTTPAYLSASATVQGTTTTLAAITPIATLMPSQAGADVTAQQAIVYTGSSESIVPNGTFILDNTQGWVLSGATYSLGGGPGAWSDAILIYASNLGENFAATPVFSVVGGATYMITVTGFYGGVTVSPNPVMRVNYGSASTGLQGWASSSSYTTIYLPFAYNFENNYSFEWVCPGGLFASIQICSNGTTGGDIYLEGVTCVPYGATGQWGADVTSLNQSATTASLSNQSLDTLSNGSTYSRQLATTLANGLPVRSGKAAILYLAPTNFWPLDNNSMTDIGTGPVNLSLFIGSGGSSGIAVQSPAPGDAIAGSYVYGQAAWYASLWSPTSWTVMTWVYFGGNLPPQGGVAGIFANANASPAGYAPTGYNPVMFVDSSGYVHAGTYGNGLNEAVSASAPNWSVPHHLACTYNYNTLTLFVDGLVVGTGSAPNSGALSIWIVGSVFGTSWPNLASGWNYCSNGINMQDVALWLGTCLSNSQVGNIFASYGNPNAASLGGVAAAAITPIASLVTSGSSSSLNKQGGLTGFGNLAFTYTGTYNTITVSWVTFDLYRSDGSITVISAGSYEFTGLATGTTYDIGCSLNVASSTLGEWMISATTSAATATTFSNLTIVTVLGLDGNIALLTGGPGMQASTAAVGSGGTSSGGSAGVPKGCPALEMFVYDGVQVGDLVIGDVLDCTDGEFPVEHDGVSLQPCVRVWTDVGHELIVSISTPFTLEDGSSCLAVAMDGSMVLTDSGHGTECVWARCHVEPAGARLVNFISVGGRTFAAGTTADRRIYSHNFQKI